MNRKLVPKSISDPCHFFQCTSGFCMCVCCVVATHTAAKHDAFAFKID